VTAGVRHATALRVEPVDPARRRVGGVADRAGALFGFGPAAIVLPVLNAAPDASAQSGIATTASSVSASTAADLAAIPRPTMS
jgi:hypothetical protein